MQYFFKLKNVCYEIEQFPSCKYKGKLLVSVTRAIVDEEK